MAAVTPRVLLEAPLRLLHLALLVLTRSLEGLGLRELPASAIRIGLRWTLWPLCRLWLRVEVRGTENLPERGPVLLCPNHQSYIDPPLVGLACPRNLVFFARHDLFDELLVGPLARFFGAEPIDRGAGEAGVDAVVRVLTRRRGFCVIYPEGRIPGEHERFSRAHLERSTGLLPGRTGPIRIALGVSAPIVPVGISGAGATLPPEAVPRGLTSWWPRRRRIRIHFGAPLEVLEPRGEPDQAFLRKETDRLMREISALVDFSLSEPPHRVPLTDADFARLCAFEASFHPGARREPRASP